MIRSGGWGGGQLKYVHSDWDVSFMSNKLQDFLADKGVATSHTTSYNPQGSGQVEKYNGVIWKAVTMSLFKSRICPPSTSRKFPRMFCTPFTRFCAQQPIIKTPYEHFFIVFPDDLHQATLSLCDLLVWDSSSQASSPSVQD